MEEQPYVENIVGFRKMEFKFSPKKGGNRRTDLLQQICDATGIKFIDLLRNTYHLKAEEGCNILQMILDDTLMFSEHQGARRDKCALLLAKSKGKVK